MATIQIKLSDAAIKKSLKNVDVTEIKGVGEPFMLRPHKSRESASWYLVNYKDGKTKRTKLGKWPHLTAKQVLIDKSSLISKLTQGNKITVNDWATVGDLLDWYCQRALSDRSLSKKRQKDVKSSITKHLKPLLGELVVDEITESVIDDKLIWTLQSKFSLSTVRFHYQLLKRALSQAANLRRIEKNPLDGVSFKTFISAKIAPKESKVKPADLPRVCQQVKECAKSGPSMLALVILCLGTRIGESRQLRWRYFDFEGARLTIPGEITKTGAELVLPLTKWFSDAVLEYQRKQKSKGYTGDFLFQARASSRGPISDTIANTWVQKVSNREWTAHDLRKLARSCWADLGVDYVVAERLLNHALTVLDQAYIHTYMEAQKRNALELWHKELFSRISP